ncbi:MAG: HEAT repeat domain-containing protein [Nitrospirota bacterium]
MNINCVTQCLAASYELLQEKTSRFLNIFLKRSTLAIFVVFILNAASANASDIDKLMKDIRYGYLQTSLKAVEELGKIEGKEAVDSLLYVVFTREEDWEVKIRAIRLLGEIEDKKVTDALVRVFNNPFLNEECPAIKWNVALALGKGFNKDSRAVDSLISALDYKSLLIREAAIQSLGKIGNPKAVPHLLTALDDESFAIKISAIRALGRIRESSAIPFLQRIAANTDDPYIRQEALSVLGILRKDLL